MPAGNLWPHLTKIDLDVASIFDPFGNAVHTATQFRLVAEDVLITGAGPVGVMAAQVARRNAARSGAITHPRGYGLEPARTPGATRAVDVRPAPHRPPQGDLGKQAAV